MTSPETPQNSDIPTPDGPTEPLGTPAPAPAIAADPAPPLAPVAPRGSGVLRWLTPTLAFLAVAVIFLLGGILIGQHTAGPGQASGVTRGIGLPGGQGQQGGVGQPGDGQQGNAIRPGNFGGLTAGTIQSIDGSTIVVKLRDGSTVSVKTTDSTTVTRTEKSTVSGLATGETVTVRGTTDGNGVTATSIAEGATPTFGARPNTNG